MLGNASNASGQTGAGASGEPPRRAYTPAEYGGHAQNFALTQDHRGVLYVGNFAGVLEYDGQSWRTLPTRNLTKVSALLTARSGAVFVGANGEFGRLQPDSTGNLAFFSLSERVKTRFADILAVLETGQGIWFVARNALFHWDGRTIREHAAGSDISTAFVHGDQVCVFQHERGLRLLDHGVFRPIAPGNGVPPLYDLSAALPLPGGRSLLVTSNQGLFQLTNNRIEPFSTPLNAWLAANQPTSGTVLGDGTLALATLRGGLALLAPNGTPQRTVPLGEPVGKQRANALLADRWGSLWVALDNGIAHLDLASAFAFFPEANARLGEINTIQRIGNDVFFATVNGLFRTQDGGIQPVPGVTGSCVALAESGGRLVVASSKGIFGLSRGSVRLISPAFGLSATASRAHPNRVYVGTQSGVGQLTLVPDGGAVYRPLPGTDGRIFGLHEDATGHLWLETLNDGLHRYNPATGRMTRYAAEQGLESPLYNRLSITTQGVLAYNAKGLFRFDSARNRFAPYRPFGSRDRSFWGNALVEDASGDVWTIGGDKKNLTWYRRKVGGYEAVSAPFQAIANTPLNVVYPDGPRIWMGGSGGLLLLRKDRLRPTSQPYTALIREVVATGNRSLYNGFTADARQEIRLPGGTPVLQTRPSDIAFTVAAPDYTVGNAPIFQYWLENYDADWSEWTAETQKPYANLPAGSYRFRVRGRNGYGLLSQEATFAFAVARRWYEHWWVLGLLAVAAVALVYAVVRWRLRVLEREKMALEALIQERTEEVVSQKQELERQSDELAGKNDQLRKIDLIVQSINAEVDFKNLYHTILASLSVIHNVEGASFLVFDQASGAFWFKAMLDAEHLERVRSVSLTPAQAEGRFLAGAEEVYEAVFRKNEVRFDPLHNPIDGLPTPRSLVTVAIEHEGRTDGLIVLENQSRSAAFGARDLDTLRHLKEHLIAAFIKTRLLEDLEATLSNLRTTQDELVRQEKLASVAQLTSGIADRMLNPLNYIINFSQTSEDVVNDLRPVVEAQRGLLSGDTLALFAEEFDLLTQNMAKIQEHGNSTSRILKDMQRLLKEKSRDFVSVDLRGFLETAVRTSLRSEQAENPSFSPSLVLDLPAEPVTANLLPTEFGLVVQNLVSNAYYTVQEKSRSQPDFRPEIRVSAGTGPNGVVLKFRDNGKGIPHREIAKLFSPFFTTKPTSKGTGLGLFMVKDIVETHRGKIDIHSQEGEFTEIGITLPVSGG